MKKTEVGHGMDAGLTECEVDTHTEIIGFSDF